MRCLPAADKTPAAVRYARRTFGFMGVYVALNVAAIAGAFEQLSRPADLVLAVAVALPVAGQIWATLMLIQESDEFLRGLLARQFIVAAGGAMAIFSGWGFAESYASAPHAPGWLVYPLFWLVFGLATAFIKTTKR